MPQAAHPSALDPELNEDRLHDFARLILDVYSEAISSTQHKYDDAYTQGSRGWAWVRKAILEHETHFPWLTIVHRGNDIQFRIGDTTVFRFFCDDPESPKKKFALAPTEAESSNITLPLFEETHEIEEPDGLWRFMIRKAIEEGDEHEVFCVKYKPGLKQAIAKWQFNKAIKTFVSSSEEIPAAAKLPPINVEPRRDILVEDETHEIQKSHDGTV